MVEERRLSAMASSRETDHRTSGRGRSAEMCFIARTFVAYTCERAIEATMTKRNKAI